MPMKPYSRKGVPYGNVFDLEKVFEQEIQVENSGSSPKGKNGARSERDSHVTKINSSIPKESGAMRGTSERPSIEARLQGYRAQAKKQSAPAKVKAKTKNQAKAR